MLHREINKNYYYLERLEVDEWEKIKNNLTLKHLIKLGIKIKYVFIIVVVCHIVIIIKQ